MEKIAFIGFGKLAIQIMNFIEQNRPGEKSYVYFDDIAFEEKRRDAHPFADYREESFKEYQFCVCLGYKHLVLKNQILEELQSLERNILTFVHPSSYIDPSAIIMPGAIIYPNCTIDQRVRIGAGTIVNNSSTISHDSIIENSCFIAPGVIINGFVQVNKSTFIGSGSVVANNLVIGEECVIGIGSTITRDVENRTKGLGNPFQVKRNLSLH